MARYLDVHPHDPQPRAIAQVVAMLRDDALVAYPTDSCYALGTRMGNTHGTDRIKAVRHLDAKHHFTLVCSDFQQLGQLVKIDNHAFRAIKAATPGPYTFILPATAEVPRRLAHPKKRTVGVRIPDNRVVHALLRELGEPLLSSTLLLPGHDDPLTDGWTVKEELDHLVDAVIDAGECGTEPTTVVDFSDGPPRSSASAPATPAASSRPPREHPGHRLAPAL
ncbi:threonylcarbamoyl-AMP synthase [Paraoerskovia sediminicola]|uniref:Threonylcarbamoyl-AMP synthase n=1 Tax=Paraoerskovia sediminicola TaxID=1138587 RepID=A0ABM8G667_9CELL|nr:threonylcarbamoyl-AMP synthase [Paraoerskovia sediminicola]